jgi:hypothetical protein
MIRLHKRELARLKMDKDVQIQKIVAEHEDALRKVTKDSTSKQKKQAKHVARHQIPRKFDGLRQGSSRSLLKANLKEQTERVSRERVSKSRNKFAESDNLTKRLTDDRQKKKVGRKETYSKACSTIPEAQIEQV